MHKTEPLLQLGGSWAGHIRQFKSLSQYYLTDVIITRLKTLMMMTGSDFVLVSFEIYSKQSSRILIPFQILFFIFG